MPCVYLPGPAPAVTVANTYNPWTICKESKCHSGLSEPWDIASGGRSEGVETFLGLSKHGRFVKAPYLRILQKDLIFAGRKKMSVLKQWNSPSKPDI